ncbi:hypothetical protein C9374_001838 [Naegleria lovaniensis]|uniref:Uncharacterized protein n=1 Tax=Naegleria lovaniensis TaxID=51637 RepID=A0AA88GVS5_NAELO|nr:uncharacterized protein C9374_001838 [Naegleria lovaniensis]KAG2386803.1 hypothetical protein C9374_001838 [Naegleria lovaniensis]
MSTEGDASSELSESKEILNHSSTDTSSSCVIEVDSGDFKKDWNIHSSESEKQDELKAGTIIQQLNELEITPKVHHPHDGCNEDLNHDATSLHPNVIENDHSNSETSQAENAPESRIPCTCVRVEDSNTYFPLFSEFIDSNSPLMAWVNHLADHVREKPSQLEMKMSKEEIKVNLLNAYMRVLSGETCCEERFDYAQWQLRAFQMKEYTERVLELLGFNVSTGLSSHRQMAFKKDFNNSRSSFLPTRSKSDESDVYTFLDECFLSRFKKFSHDKFVFDKAEDLKPFYAKISESLKDKEKIPFRITNYLREYIHNNATILVSYLKHCVENRVNIDTNLRCINEFRYSWERRNTWISSENHLEVIHLQWITGMLVDFGLNVKKNCKVTPSAGISRMDSQYCQPDVCVEEKAICMEYKLENVTEFLPDIRKVCILPIVLMKEHNLKTGMGLLADRKHAYVFCIKKQFNMVLEWEYCQCFDLEDLGERCLLFVVLIKWLANACEDNEFILKEWDDLYELAETWNEGKTSHNENASNKKTNQSSQESSNRFVPNAPPSKNQSSNMNSHNNSQQRKLIMLQRKTKERSKIILNDVSHFVRRKESCEKY